MNRTWLFLLVSPFTACAPGPEDGGTRLPICTTLESHTSSTTTPLTFTADIQPIITEAYACGLAIACHGQPAAALDRAGLRSMSFVGAPATVLGVMKSPSVNAPAMNNVVAGQVGRSFLSYKLHGTDGMSCVASMCVAGASVGVDQPCGEPMPTVGGTLSAEDRSKILDWIAQGAAE